MKKIIFFVIITFSLTAFAGLEKTVIGNHLTFAAGPGEPVIGTPLVYKVHIIRLGFSKTSSKDDCVYPFVAPDQTSGVAFDLASVQAGAAVGSLANNATVLPAGTYTHICGKVQNGFEVVGSTSIGCTDSSISSRDTVDIANPQQPGHYFVQGASKVVYNPGCEVHATDTPQEMKIPTVGDDMHVPDGVTMTAEYIEFFEELSSSFTIVGGSGQPVINLAFDVSNTVQMLRTVFTGSSNEYIALFMQPPRPTVTIGS